MMQPTSDHPYPRVGVCVLVMRQGKFLLGLRQGAHGANTWAPPGGKLELGETWEDCAKREVLEETGMNIADLRFLTATNDIFASEGLHFVTIFFVADWVANEPRIMEPDKCLEWGWYSYDELPEPLFLTIQNLKKRYPNELPKT